jgi:site-specific DNA-cytosine methylase
MSAHCSAALADSTTASAGLGFDTRSSVSRILGGEGCLGSGGLESPSTTTYELWVAQKGFEGKFQTDRYTTPSLVTGGTKQGEVPLLFSAAASPAKTSQLPDAELDSKPEKLVPLIENVPGLLSSQGGRDFALVLATLAELGFHDLAWRVLDSRYFGVPQRRRRVFVLGRRDSGQRCFQILLEPESGGGDLAAGGEAGAGTAFASLSGLGSGGPDDNDAQAGRVVTAFHHLQDPISGGVSPSLSKEGMAIADTLTSGSHPGSNMPGRRREDDTNIVRRLTPVECERLQGLPDGWTRVPDTAPDSRRYAGLGDAVTSPVAEWIGRRLLAVEAQEQAA